VRALATAHVSMHAVEAWQQLPLREHSLCTAPNEQRLLAELDRCIALDTFAYCIGRSAPWLFAEETEEAERIFDDLSGAWQNVVPTRGMWIAEQVCLLALHRRAYARSLKHDLPVRRTEAYNDYHKLQRLIRDATRRVESAPIHIDGALEFLEALDAQAHHHIGELYRTEHAQRPAVKHFRTASYRLDQLKERLRRDQAPSTTGHVSMSDALTDSRWLVELQLSQGKAHYEMGHHKESLCWHLRAWRAFLQLLAADTRTEAGTKDLDEAIEWLTAVRFEPELRKAEASRRLAPIVAQLDRIAVERRLGALAADVLLRLGHLLFVLNLGLNKKPPAEQAVPEGASEKLRAAAVADERRRARRRVDSTLGFRCLRKAAECDQYNTLVGADLLKARFRLRSWFRRRLPPAYVDALAHSDGERLGSVEQQWPGGGDDYEQVVRVAEYLMLKAHPYAINSDARRPETPVEQDRLIAHELLLNFFMHTDSINVRKSQVHRYLMQPSVCEEPEIVGPAIEFVCMRRYSSAFPLLPRPSAFRALGGGYFVRLHGGSRSPRRPYGIVIDPGPDFIENLYRTGFSLNDTDLIIVTHDHVDHLGALDSLLSILFTRAVVHRDKRLAVDKSEIPLLLNDSVRSRYLKATSLRMDRRGFDLRDFTASAGGTTQLPGFPHGEFELIAMSTTVVDGRGHLDLSYAPSYGLCFRVGDGSASLAIAGDTPRPRTDKERPLWLNTWRPALEADLLVAHLSTVPLAELRQISRLNAAADRSAARDVWQLGVDELSTESQELLEICDGLAERNDGELKGLLNYALWLRAAGRSENEPASLLGRVGKRDWTPLQGHAYLGGTLDWAREYRIARKAAGKPDGLFVIGELSEELGTMRGKVAKRLNDTVFAADDPDADDDRHYALTSDIGLQAFVGPDLYGCGRRTPAQVRCTTCHLDMDRVRREQLHRPQEIDEVCVKGENEGIFYNCEEHTSYLSEQPIFLEQLERFDVFGR
jgi:hypothetical protein